MKKNVCILIPLFAVAGFVLRRLQLAGSYDELGLIPHGDGISVALNLLGVLGMVLILLLCRRLPKAEQSPMGGKPFAVGKLLAAAGLLASLLPPTFGTALPTLVTVFGLCSVVSLALEGIFQLRGQTGSLIGGCVVTVYLMVYLISKYLEWSYSPTVADFVFPLVFSVCVMLATYRLAAFRMGKGLRRRTLFYGLCALIFAGPVLAEGGLQSVLRTAALCLYLICALWPQLSLPEQPEE